LKVKVEVFLKPGVLDVQGKATEAALKGLGFAGVSDVRIGRVIKLDTGKPDAASAKAEATAMGEKLLANGVIESFTVEVL
jgi:phosphoribosylformylglycinamidine synthase